MTISLTVILIESTNEISYGLPLMIVLMVGINYDYTPYFQIFNKISCRLPSMAVLIVIINYNKTP